MVGEISPSAGAAKDEANKLLVELIPLENHWTPDGSAGELAGNKVGGEATYTKHRRYSIDPKDILQVQKQARQQGLNIIGVYHSHPDDAAVPSECDRAQAWPEYAYVIVSVQGISAQEMLAQGKESGSKAVDIQNWALDSNHQFQPEAMQVSPSLTPNQASERMPISA